MYTIEELKELKKQFLSKFCNEWMDDFHLSERSLRGVGINEFLQYLEKLEQENKNK